MLAIALALELADRIFLIFRNDVPSKNKDIYNFHNNLNYKLM